MVERGNLWGIAVAVWFVGASLSQPVVGGE